MLKYSIIALFISLLFSLSYIYKSMRHSTVERREVLLFERRENSLYFQTMAETMYYPFLVELVIEDLNRVGIIIRKKSLHSNFKIKDSDLKVTSKLIQLKPIRNTSEVGFSVKIPKELESANFYLK